MKSFGLSREEVQAINLDYFKNTNSNRKLKALTFRRQLTPSSELFVDSSP